MTTLTAVESRLDWLDVPSLSPPPRLIVNPHAGRKLGLPTNAATLAAVEQALMDAGIHVQIEQTRVPSWRAKQSATAASWLLLQVATGLWLRPARGSSTLRPPWASCPLAAS
jgi:hypothetical protein